MSPVIPLIINPAARRGRAARRAERIRFLFSQRGIATELLFSKGIGDISELVERRAAEGAGHIIVAGGDGSVLEAVTGLMRAGTSAALGLVPTGSGNDFAKASGIDLDWQQSTVALADRIATEVEPTRIDVGRCNDRYFANGIGIGFDAVVTRYARDVRLPIGDLVYIAGLLRALAAGIVTPELTVEADDFQYAGRATLVNVANGPWLGGQFNIAPRASNGDGVFDLVMAEPVTRLRVATLVPLLKQGQHLDEPEVRHARVRRVVVTSAEPTPSHLDGEVQPLTDRFDIGILPGALRLL